MSTIQPLPRGPLPPRLVGLAALACWLLFFVQFTHATANILAWGLDAWKVADRSSLFRLGYDATHRTAAYAGYNFGLAVTGVVATALFARNKVSGTTLSRTVVGLGLMGSAGFAILHILLLSFQGGSHTAKVLGAAFTHPGEEYDYVMMNWLGVAWLLAPAILALTTVRRRFWDVASGARLAYCLSLPLLGLPWALGVYQSHTYMCFGSDDTISILLRYAGWPFLLAPPILYGLLVPRQSPAR